MWRQNPLLLLLLNAASNFAVAEQPSYELREAGDDVIAYGIYAEGNSDPIVQNTAILAGITNETTSAVGLDSSDTEVNATMITPSIARIEVTSSQPFLGAMFGTNEQAKHYGVWGYPWNDSIINENIEFDLKGLQSSKDINYLSARSPFFISSTGYAVYTDTMAMGSYAFSTDDQEVRFIFNTSQLVYHIILPTELGSMKSLLEQYASLSDTTALWPSAAFGPMFWHNDFQNEDGFPPGVNNSQEFVQDVASKLADNKVRASNIMVDRPYGTGTEGWGNFDFNSSYWPDIESLVSELGGHGLEFQVWVANRAVPESQLHDEGTRNDWLFSEMVTEEDASIALNLSIPEAYDYFKERMTFFPDVGVKGYKIDRGDEDEMPVFEQNIQSYLYHKLLYENQAEKWGAATDTQPAGFFNYARSVSDRSRKYTAVWAADPASTVDGLRASIRSGVRAGLLGFPMWGSDCGGYTRRAGQELPLEDTWARWMWFSAFSPVYETMLFVGTIPWYDYSEELMDVMRATTQLHHELVPFIQSYIYRATKDGLPVIRALFLEAPEDETVWESGESYFFGEEFLIAPITSADGTKPVYFPKGGKYLEYFDKTDVFDGGQEVTFTLDIHSVPAFVREGAIVPRGDLMRTNNRWDDDWKPALTVEVYPGYGVKKSAFEYYVEVDGTVANIHLEADGGKKQVCVSYGRLGTNGTLAVYLKDKTQSFGLEADGGKECIEDATTLFD